MVPPSLSSTLTASCCRGERYFQATSAILRLPRGPVEWEGRRRDARKEARPSAGSDGNSSLTMAERLSRTLASATRKNYICQRRFVQG